MIGKIVSIKMNKSATVLVTRRATHPLYKKTYTQSKKYLVHDELETKLGDIVEIQKVRPISKMKHFKIVKIIGKNLEDIVSEHLQEKGAEAISEVMPEEKVEESSVPSEVQSLETKEGTEEKQEKKKTSKKKGKK